jgi:hypothetical protein
MSRLIDPAPLCQIQRPDYYRARRCLLNELPEDGYVDTAGRIVRARCREREDELGPRPYIYGIIEDSTFKVPFISYKPLQLFNGAVHGFHGVYSHRLEDGSYLLIVTEGSRVLYLDEEPPEDYVWDPKIGSIGRPTGMLTVPLRGIVARISSEGSGLVKRCEECGRVLFQERCPSGHAGGWYWDVRVSATLSDGTGSIPMILGQHLTCRVLEMPISAIMLMAAARDAPASGGFTVEAFSVEAPKALCVREAYVEDPSIFRSRDHLIVADFERSKIYCPMGLRVNSSGIISHEERVLDFSRREDRWLILRLFRKALEGYIAEETGLPEIHGIHLLEEPIPLYGAERAKLYLGFELRVSEDEGSILVEAYPQAYVRESVLDYVAWRRGRGASARSIERTLTGWRSEVLCAPYGMRARVARVLFKDAGEVTVPDQNLSLPEFWRLIHGLEVGEEERPCLIVRPHSVDLELTYPPSMVFFDEHSLWLSSSTRAFMESKKRYLAPRARETLSKALARLRIDDYRPRLLGEARQRVDARRLILQRLRERLLGKPVYATGPIRQICGRLYFFPRTLQEAS